MTEWKPVSEEIPDDSVLVLGYSVNHDGLFLCWYSEYSELWESNTSWQERPDYWMPIPKVPKKNHNEDIKEWFHGVSSFYFPKLEGISYNDFLKSVKEYIDERL